MKINKFLKSIIALAFITISVIFPAGCGKGEFRDYLAETHFSTDRVDWKTSNFMETGFGVVTLRKNVDGDTAHFYVNYHNNPNYVIQGRFNGVNTPESTGIIEEWGKAAANYTANILNNAKTILLETEREDDLLLPQEDGSTGRYLVWVWTSTRPIEEEDGSQLQLLNLGLVQNGYSFASGNADSKYEDVFLDADAQAQRHKLHIWSKDKDELFYYGDATITDMRSIFADPSQHLGQKVYVEGVVTRTMGTNAYIQQTYEEDDGTYSTYGTYIFTQYKSYEILKPGNYIGVTGIVAEHYGSYQLVDVSYNKDLQVPDDMKLLDTNVEVEPQLITVEQALSGNYLNTLCKIEGLVATGGYGGKDEIDDRTGYPYENNSMTIFVTEKSTGKKFNVRIDSSTFIKDEYGDTIRSYKYFKDYCSQSENHYFDLVGVVGRYENLSGDIEIQLMLITTRDITYYPN